MRIDVVARQKLAEHLRQRKALLESKGSSPELKEAISGVSEAVKTGSDNTSSYLSLLLSLYQQQTDMMLSVFSKLPTEIQSDKIIQYLSKQEVEIKKLYKAAANVFESDATKEKEIRKAITESLKTFKITLPKVFPIEGDVSVSSLPPLRVENLSDLGNYFSSLEGKLGELAQIMSKDKDVVPKGDFSTSQSLRKAVLSVEEAVKSLREPILGIKSSESVALDPSLGNKLDGIESAMRELLDFEINRPTLTPPPVTNVSINSLKGFPFATAVTVTSVPTLLPPTNLSNRRSLIIFNNDSTNTLFVGDSGVTTSSGLPVLAQSYSPPMDAGENMGIYGVCVSGSLNTRVLEISDTKTGR